MDESLKDRRWARLSLLLGTTILVFYAAMLSLGGLGLTFKVALAPSLLGAALLLAFWYVSRSELALGTSERLGVAVALILLQAVGVHTAMARFDLSFDGRWYHKEAILQLVQGWNPYRDAPIRDLGIGPNGIGGKSWQENLAEQQVNGFPKGPWIAGAAYALMFDELEAAKTPTTLLLVASFFIAFGSAGALADRLKGRHALAALLLAFNPVSVSQVGTTMVDGQVASLLACLLCLGFLSLRKPASRSILFGFAVALGSLMLVKFTGLAFGAIFLSAAVVIAAVFHRGQALRIGLAGTAALVTSFLAIGWHPYLTNILRYDWMFYPLARYDARGVTPQSSNLNWTMPTDFRGRGGVDKLARSLVARSENPGAGASWPKLPWQVFDSEGACFATQGGCQVGGWGPLFVLGLLLAAIGSLLAAVRSSVLATTLEAVTGLGFILVSVVAIPEAWAARYAPQLSFVPIGIWLLLSNSRRPTVRWVSHALGLVLALNCAFVIRTTQGEYRKATTWFNGQVWRIDNATKRTGSPVLINFGTVRSLRFLLDQRSIPFREVPRNLEGCEPVESLYEVVWCAAPKP